MSRRERAKIAGREKGSREEEEEEEAKLKTPTSPPCLGVYTRLSVVLSRLRPHQHLSPALLAKGRALTLSFDGQRGGSCSYVAVFNEEKQGWTCFRHKYRAPSLSVIINIVFFVVFVSCVTLWTYRSYTGYTCRGGLPSTSPSVRVNDLICDERR